MVQVYVVAYRQAVTGLFMAARVAGGYAAQGYAARLTGMGHKVLYVRAVVGA